MSDFDFSSSVSCDVMKIVLNEVRKPLGLYSDRIPWWIESSEKQYLFEIEIFRNIINVLTVIFYLMHPCQTKAYFLKKL